jgi:hypothetical protein
MIWCIAIVKPRTTEILCPCSYSVCVCSKKQEKRTWEKWRGKKKQKKCQPNPLTWESHILINWKFNPIPLDTLIVPYKRKYFFNVKKGSIHGFNSFQFVWNWSLRFWTLDHHLNWVLTTDTRTPWMPQDTCIHNCHSRPNLTWCSSTHVCFIRVVVLEDISSSVNCGYEINPVAWYSQCTFTSFAKTAMPFL